MITMKELEFYIFGLKQGDIQDKLSFSEMIKLYDGIICLCREFMQSYTHFLWHKIYGVCSLIHALYMLSNKNYEDTWILKVEKNLVEDAILKHNWKVSEETIKTFKKIVANLLWKSSIMNIKDEMDKVNENMLIEIKKELIEASFLGIKEYCQDITKEDIIARSDEMFNYDDSWWFEWMILEEQKKKNQEPDITKEDFFEKYPEFKKSLDRHWLIDLSLDDYELLRRFNFDWMYYKDYFIYFDDLFLNFDKKLFLDNFLNFSCSNKWKNVCKIRLNYNKIISLKKYKYVMLVEWVYFWPDYNPDKFFITENKPSELTVKRRESEKFNECFWNFIERTEFKFDPKNNSFLIEEVWRNENNWFYVNRLAHCEFDITKKIVKHFDGSMLFYDMDSYYVREDTNLLKQENLEHSKVKLFQIDWEVSIKEREKLLLSYYMRNELVLEYLDEESYKNNYENLLK